jgi:H/ACA ribonucleoprotein complex subunit 2
MGSDTEAENKRAPVALAPIAKPLAGKKLCKRTLKLVRRGLYGSFALFAVGLKRFPMFRCDCLNVFAASEAKCLKRGVKEVVKSIRRGNKGFVIYTALLYSCIFFSFVCFMVQRSENGNYRSIFAFISPF